MTQPHVSFDDFWVLIPVYNSDSDSLKEYVKQLKSTGLNNILFVDDGSTPQCSHMLHIIANTYECVVLTHEVNQGKGAALKTGFRFCRDSFHDTNRGVGVICVDSDGQHTVEDVLRIVNDASERSAEEAIIFGARDFSSKNVPFRSRFGNTLTCHAMRIFHGIKLQDTQTGLRFIPASLLSEMIDVKGNRFEYETNMLIQIARDKTVYREIPIQTVYIADNASSHFRPLTDSIRIYFSILSTFFAFLLSSMSAAIIDFGIFAIAIYFLQDSVSPPKAIAYATIIARAVSSLFNFTLNKQLVFQSNKKVTTTIIAYYLLAIIQLAASAYFVSLFWHLFGAVRNTQTLVKIIVDAILFVISFQIQRRWIFIQKHP